MASFFVDSSIIIEALKVNGDEKASEIWEKILTFLYSVEFAFCVNAVVYSEVVYKLILKCKKKREIEEEYVYRIFRVLSWLDIPYDVKEIAEFYIKTYAMRTNDALILATCKHYGITHLISLDEDFKEPCEKESIVLIDSAEKLKRILEKS
jgi:predicted nucleic acid-binding protein